jgi:hypothetical protein
MQIRSAGLLRLAFLLGDEKNQLVGFNRSVDRGQRRGPSDQKRDDYIGKNNNVSER